MSAKATATRKNLGAQEKARKVADVKKSEKSLGIKSIFSAVLKGKLSDVVLFLTKSSSVNDLYENGSTLLHIASAQGHSQIVELLLRHNAKIDCENENGLTPLHLAIISGHLEVVKLLLNASQVEGKYTLIQVTSKARDTLNYTPLHLAARYGHDKIIAFLINCGADTDAEIELNSFHKEDPDATPLHVAITSGHKKCIRLLLKYESYEYLQEDEMLMMCAVGGAIYYDSSNGRFNRNMSKKEQLHRAEIIDILLNAGAKFHGDIQCYSALNMASHLGRNWLVKKILARGININSRSMNNETALHSACESGSSNTARILLEAGADINLKTEAGVLPLHYAAYGGNLKILSMLTTAGADINAKVEKDENKELFIESIIAKGDTKDFFTCLYAFLRYGLDLHDKDPFDECTLHCLKHFYSNDYSAILLDWSPDFNVLNDLGETPLDFALDYEDKLGKKIKAPDFVIKVMVIMEIDKGFKISKENMLLISKFFFDVYDDCTDEFKRLKNKKLWGEITFKDILHTPLETLKMYTFNTEFMQAFNSFNWNSLPQYGGFMKSRILFATKLRKFYEEGVNTLTELLCPIKIPHHITHDILSFLNLGDFMQLSSMKMR